MAAVYRYRCDFLWHDAEKTVTKDMLMRVTKVDKTVEIIGAVPLIHPTGKTTYANKSAFVSSMKSLPTAWYPDPKQELPMTVYLDRGTGSFPPFVDASLDKLTSDM